MAKCICLEHPLATVCLNALAQAYRVAAATTRSHFWSGPDAATAACARRAGRGTSRRARVAARCCIPDGCKQAAPSQLGRRHHLQRLGRRQRLLCSGRIVDFDTAVEERGGRRLWGSHSEDSDVWHSALEPPSAQRKPAERVDAVHLPQCRGSRLGLHLEELVWIGRGLACQSQRHKGEERELLA